MEDTMHPGPVTRSIRVEFVQPPGPCFVWDAVRNRVEEVCTDLRAKAVMQKAVTVKGQHRHAEEVAWLAMKRASSPQ